MSRFTVVFDACCLYPAPLRDFLMELATAELFRAKWTWAIHDEWMRNLLANRPDLSPEKLRRTCDLMNEKAPDCLVEGYEHLIPVVSLPDPDDHHVVAAAVHARADPAWPYRLCRGTMPRRAVFRCRESPASPERFLEREAEVAK